MLRKILSCDRCKKELPIELADKTFAERNQDLRVSRFKPFNYPPAFIISDIDAAESYGTYNHLDLCDSCYKQLKDWLGGSSFDTSSLDEGE